MYNMLQNNLEEELLALLVIQGVIKVKSFATTGPNNSTKILPMVALYFNTTNLPKEVTIAHESFVRSTYRDHTSVGSAGPSAILKNRAPT